MNIRPNESTKKKNPRDSITNTRKNIKTNADLTKEIITPRTIALMQQNRAFLFNIHSKKDIVRIIRAQKEDDVAEYAKIGDDGKSLVIRIPAKIRDKYTIKKGQYMKFADEPSETALKITICEKYGDDRAVIDYKMITVLKLLYEYSLSATRPSLSTNRIRGITGLDWDQVNTILHKLLKYNLVVKHTMGKRRIYPGTGKVKTIESERNILWRLNNF